MNDSTLAVLDACEARRAHLLEELAVRPAGTDWCERHTQIMDDVIRALVENLRDSMGEPPELAIVATGGYGRREVAPCSDVDVTIVPMDEADPRLDPAVRTLFRTMQQAFDGRLKIKVGYAFRLIGDAPGLDAKTRTGLLDSRLVAGSRAPLDALMRAYWSTFPVAEFLIAKLEERDAAMLRYGDTPYVAEPQLKEGAGGLRCFHCANWIGAAIGERMSRPGQAYDHILRVRNLLHRVSRHHLDQMTRGRRVELAESLGQEPLKFGAAVAESMAELHTEFRRAKERLREARFVLSPGVVALRGEARVSAEATASGAALGIALATRLGLQVADIPASTRMEVVGPEALVALTSGEPTLRNLDRCRVLDRLLPELAACRTLMSNDNAHAYTVFEHTMRMIRLLDRTEPNSFQGELRAALRDMSVLYLSALLHDVGKADPNQPHSEAGEQIARHVGTRWRLPEPMVEEVAWLIREHLTMARFIRMRDVMVPETAMEFAKVVGRQDRLVLLALLTWADVNAVSPEAWTPVQETFFRELFVRTQSVLAASDEVTPDEGAFRRRILRQLRKAEIPQTELERFIESLPAHYVFSVEPERVREHYHLAEKAMREGEPTIEVNDKPELSATEVTVCTRDEPGLLSRLLGVFYALDLSIVGIRATTTESDPAVAIDTFTVTFGNRPAPPATARRLSSELEAMLRGKTLVDTLLQRVGKDPQREQEIFTWSYAEGAPGILEIRAPRGRGMAYRISRRIAEQGWNILAARVGQWAGSGAAAFYLEAPDGGAVPYPAVEAALGSSRAE